MIYLDLFSGIGGFALGFERAGWKFTKHFNSEIDKYASSIYAKHFPEAIPLGDIANVKVNTIPIRDGQTKSKEEGARTLEQGIPNATEGSLNSRDKSYDNGGRTTGEILYTNGDHYATTITNGTHTETFEGKINLITFGFPCQDLSIAGKRKGLSGSRSGLFFEATRIIRECRPDIFIFENVQGLLSSNNGKDFEVVLREIADIGLYECEWQLVNTSWVLPQNRERIYFIGHRLGTSFGKVFPVEPPKRLAKGLKYEKVFDVSSVVPQVKEILRLRQEDEGWSKELLQKVCKRIWEEVSQGKCRELQEEGQKLQLYPIGDLQETEKLFSWSVRDNSTGEVCGVASIPNKEVLLLWNRGESPSISFRLDKQQDISFDGGQDRLLKRLRGGELGSLLFAVQLDQKRLFYSIGDGRDWQKLYSKEVGRWEMNLSDILQTLSEVDEKYFLSQLTEEKVLSRIKKEIKQSSHSMFINQPQFRQNELSDVCQTLKARGDLPNILQTREEK